MSTEEICKYLGFAVVVVVAIYVLLRSMRFQANIIESMVSGGTDKDKVSDAVKSNTHSIDDTLLISKYRTAYENTLIDLEANISSAIVQAVVTNAEAISKNPADPQVQTVITGINNLKAFLDTLNSTMVILDKK
tara:strand:- start:1290 stop:1691 length:402 start_codon:yes stop_codon:yes gene_type:complete